MFQIIIAAILFSTGGAAIKLTTLSGWQVASYRSLIAFIILAIYSKKLQKGFGLKAILVGLVYAGCLTCFVISNKLTTSLNAIALQSTAPFYVALFGFLFLKEKLSKLDILGLFGFLIAMYLFISAKEQVYITAPNPELGNAIALLAGFFWAFVILGLKWLSRSVDKPVEVTLGAVIYGNFFGFLLSFPNSIITPFDFSAVNIVTILFLGIFQIALAYIFLTKGISKLPAFQVSLVLLLEPVLNTLWSWLIHGENPSPSALAGGILILLITFSQVYKDKTNKSVLG